MKVSARNVFAGTVTNGTGDNFGLKFGKEAFAIIKASSIILGTDLHDAKVSARNIMCGTIAKVIDGPVSTEVDIEIGGGNTVSAVITHNSAVSAIAVD